MTTQKYINKNKTNTLKKGDKVIMINCGEANFYKGKIWECETHSFSQIGNELVFLKGFSGSFLTKYLVKK